MVAFAFATTDLVVELSQARASTPEALFVRSSCWPPGIGMIRKAGLV
jgi:hypothetical protein